MIPVHHRAGSTRRRRSRVGAARVLGFGHHASLPVIGRPHEPVVVMQVGRGPPRAASRPRRSCRASVIRLALVDAVSLLDEMLGGGRGRLEAAGVRRPWRSDGSVRLPIPRSPSRRCAAGACRGSPPRMGLLAPRAGASWPAPGSRQAGFLTVLPHLPYTRGSVFHLPAVTGCGSPRRTRARPTLQRPPRATTGPAR